MKNVIKHSRKGFLMVTMFATLLSFANEVSFFKVKNDAKRTLISLNVKEGNLLSIIDDNGMILYKELIQKAGVYTKGFDLTSLPNGKYTFELDKDLEINTIHFTVLSGNVVFNKEEEKVFYKPFIRVKDDMLYISKLTLNDEPLKVDIYYANTNDLQLIHSEELENTQNIQKIYKLAGSEKGNYRIVLQSEDRTFTKNI